MKKILKYLSLTDWAYNLSVKIVATRIVHSKNRLTRDYLINKGWILIDGNYWIEKGVKDRDRIYIKFEHHYYRVWHGNDRSFVALESSLEWFENYYLLMHGDNGRYKLAGI